MQLANKDLITLLNNAKTDNRSMAQVIDQFQPLLSSYSRKSGWKIDTEDMHSILTIKLIETIQSMDVPRDVGACVSYISTRIKFGFLDTIKKLNKISDSEVSTEFLEQSSQYDTLDIEFDSIVENLDIKKQEILRLKFKSMLSDQEIGDKLGISRQMVNKHLRAAYKELLPSLQ